jgi:hypothetical protein
MGLMRWASPAGFLPALLLGGCFTEVGNSGKETRMHAEFSIDYSPAGALLKQGVPDTGLTVDQFYLSVLEAEYHLASGGEKYLWEELDSGYAVDFTGEDRRAVLPVRAVEPDTIVDFRLFCRMRPLPETLSVPDFAAFSDRGYIKGAWRSRTGAHSFLFALPGSGRLRVIYSKDFQETWRDGDGYRIRIIFFARRWLSEEDLLFAEPTLDGRGVPYILLDSSHNAALHQELTDRFLKAFNANIVDIR